MARPSVEDRGDAIVETVIRLLETEGYDAVQVRRVAAEASVSLATMYKLYGSRDELIVCAVETWMAANAYAGLGELSPTDSAYEALAAIVRSVFARWEHQPHMLAAFIRARFGPGGARLGLQGFDVVEPIARRALADLDPDLLADLVTIVEHVLLGALDRFAAGEIAVDDIAPILDRTLLRILEPQRAPAVDRSRSEIDG